MGKPRNAEIHKSTIEFPSRDWERLLKIMEAEEINTYRAAVLSCVRWKFKDLGLDDNDPVQSKSSTTIAQLKQLPPPQTEENEDILDCEDLFA